MLLAATRGETGRSDVVNEYVQQEDIEGVKMVVKNCATQIEVCTVDSSISQCGLWYT